MITGPVNPKRLTRRAALRAGAMAAALGGIGQVGCAGLAPADSQAGLPALVLPAGLGVNLHPGSTALTQIAQLAAVGFRLARLDLLWDRVERRRGHYDFSPYEPIIEALRARGVRPLCLLGYDNALYERTSAVLSAVAGLHTEQARLAFARFAQAAVAHFRGRGIIWELWNEPDNVRFWLPAPSPDEYMALATLAVPAMRQSDPDATIVLPALTGLEPQYQVAWDFLERCFALGLLRLADAVSVHPYRLGVPESAAFDYQRLRLSIARFTPEGRAVLPIVNTEWGYSLSWVSRQQQAAYVVRLALVNLLNRVAVSIWYDWQDDGADPRQLEDNFGLLTWTQQPKPAWLAARTLVRELSGFHLLRRLPLASGADYALFFTDGVRTRQVVWTQAAPHALTVSGAVSTVVVSDMLGKRRTLPLQDGRATLWVSGEPQYLSAAEALAPGLSRGKQK